MTWHITWYMIWHMTWHIIWHDIWHVFDTLSASPAIILALSTTLFNVIRMSSLDLQYLYDTLSVSPAFNAPLGLSVFLNSAVLILFVWLLYYLLGFPRHGFNTVKLVRFVYQEEIWTEILWEELIVCFIANMAFLAFI